MNGHELLAHTFKALGVTHVYSISGSPIKATLPACSQVGIRVIGVHDQQAAGFMALAHNYVCGRLTAIAILSAGPAVTNATTSILVAKDNCWPLLVIGGKNSISVRTRPGTFQMLDGATLFQPLTKWAAEVDSPEKIVEYVNCGYYLAMTGQPGPVYLDLPGEVLNDCASFVEAPLPKSPITPKPDSMSIRQAAECLLQAQRPAVIIGKGIRWSEPFEELRSLIETYHIPFITSPMGRGLLPDDHPLCFNVARDDLQHDADVVLVLGARLNWTFRFGRQFAQDATVIHIDIAQEELANNLPGFIGIRGDVKQVLRELLGCLEQQQEAQGSLGRDKWLERLGNSRHTQTLNLEKKINHSGLPMSPHRLMKEIRDFLPRHAICVLEGRDTMAAAQEVLLSYEPASRFTAGTNGCMGIGIPFGIGAKLSAADRMVVVICGDMGFGMSAIEMETAVRHKIPIIVVVVNNDGPCATNDFRTLYPLDHEPATRYLPRIRYEKIMEAFRGYAESVDQPEQVQPALRRAVESGLPACLNVYVDPQAPFKNYVG
jgi:thiamine pyrophosphate-dependent acetolactate synthase large subunit-like protein